MVSTKFGLYVTGGYRWEGGVNYGDTDSIFELNIVSENSTWVELTQKIMAPRSYVAALILPDELAICD